MSAGQAKGVMRQPLTQWSHWVRIDDARLLVGFSLFRFLRYVSGGLVYSKAVIVCPVVFLLYFSVPQSVASGSRSELSRLFSP